MARRTGASWSPPSPPPRRTSGACTPSAPPPPRPVPARPRAERSVDSAADDAGGLVDRRAGGAGPGRFGAAVPFGGGGSFISEPAAFGHLDHGQRGTS